MTTRAPAVLIKCFNQNSFVFKSTANMVHHGLDHGITVNQNTSPLTSRLCDETTRGGHIWNSLGITRFNFEEFDCQTLMAFAASSTAQQYMYPESRLVRSQSTQLPILLHLFLQSSSGATFVCGSFKPMNAAPVLVFGS